MIAPLISIVLPTFNERENVHPLLDQIEAALSNESYSYEILFVDDSLDDTPQIIEERMLRNSSIRMIHRTGSDRTGLATAFIRGFEQANGTYICCLDADLQHPPTAIPRLVEKALATDADLVVATRYIQGGSAAGLGGVYRRAVSIGLKIFTQIIFVPTRLTTDPGSGFFLFKKKIVQDVVLQPRGFKILIEILMRARYDRQKVHEIAYRFLPRENDASKATVKQGLEFLSHLWYLFRTIPEAGRSVKFMSIGTAGVLIHLGMLQLGYRIMHLGLNTGWLVGVLLSIGGYYSLNRIFSYPDPHDQNRTADQSRLMRYYALWLVMVLPNFALFRVGIAWGFHYLLSAFVAMVITTLITFILLSTFGWDKPTRPPE